MNRGGRQALEAVRGVTLLELLTVLVILAIVMGISAAVFVSLGRVEASQAAVWATVSALRQAEREARVRSGPTFVVVLPKEGKVYAVRREIARVWPLDSDVTVGTLTTGRVGLGVQVDSSMWIGLGSAEIRDPSQGFFAEVWVYPLRVRSGLQVILEVYADHTGPDLFRLAVEDMIPKAWFGETCVEAPRAIPSEAWTRLEVFYERGRQARIFVNGAGAGAGDVEWTPPQPGTAQIGCRGGRQELGDPAARPPTLVGIVDEVSVGQMIAGDAIQFPAEAALVVPEPPAPDPLIVSFDPTGRLDPRVHAAAVRFGFRSGQITRWITVLPNGLVQRSDAEGP